MGKLLYALLLLSPNLVMAECQAPGQGFLEEKVKEVFYGPLGESELKEWLMHPKNLVVRQDLKEIDRKSKFAGRLKREELLLESRTKFEEAIINNERPSDIENFPIKGTSSKISGSEGALTLEMYNLSKEKLDVLPEDILEKLDAKIKIQYHYPYDKFVYLLTYKGRELPMKDALLLVQADFENSCELRKIDNREYREWYQKKRRDNGYSPAGASSSQ